MKLIFSLALALVLFPSHSQASERLNSVREQLATILYRCPTRVWPGASWSGDAFILVENGLPFRLTASELTPDQLTPDESDELKGNVFAITQHPDRRIVVQLAADEEYPQRHRKIADLATQIAYHEGFHLFQQWGAQPWTLAMQRYSPDPAKVFPFKSTPYYYYQRLIENLQAYLSGSDESSLRKAKYWYIKLRAEYSYFLDEITGGSLLEGAAVYAELVGAAIAKHGCAVSEETILQEIMADFERVLPTGHTRYGDTSYTAFMYDYAPYIYLSIRKLGKQEKLADVKRTGTLFSLLFQHGPQLLDSKESPSERAEIERRVEESNQGIQPPPRELAAKFLREDTVKLSFPDERIKLDRTGPHLKFPRYGISARLTAKYWLGESAMDSPLLKYADDPCGGDRSIILADAVHERKAVVGEASFDLNAAKSRSVDGHQWYCF